MLKALVLYKTLWAFCSHPDCKRSYSVDCYDKRDGIKKLRGHNWAIYNIHLAYCPQHRARGNEVES